jgi:hypothetical protein
MDRDLHKIARNVDAPVPVMFWDPVEFSIAISLMGFGVLANMWMLGMLGAIVVLSGSRKLKRGAKRGAVQHFIWAKGVQVDKALKVQFPPAWHSDFIE